MTGRLIAVLALRVLAVYVVAQGMLHVAQWIWMLPSYSEPGAVPGWWTGTLLLFPTLLGVALWVAARPLGRLAVADVGGDDARPLTTIDLTASAFIVAGVVILLLSLPALLVALYHLASGELPPGSPWVVSRLAQCLLAVALLLRAGTLARLLHRLRDAGLR